MSQNERKINYIKNSNERRKKKKKNTSVVEVNWLATCPLKNPDLKLVVFT
jgi:hypothetical protein